MFGTMSFEDTHREAGSHHPLPRDFRINLGPAIIDNATASKGAVERWDAPAKLGKTNQNVFHYPPTFEIEFSALKQP